MKRRAPLRRKSRLRSRNPERLERLRAKQFGKQADLCRALPCLVCKRTPSVAAHVRSRGAGGVDSDVVPLCHACHEAQHREGIRTFQAKHGIDLAAEADRLHHRVNGTSERP